MGFRRIVLAMSVSALLFAVPAAAKGPTPAPSGACPTNPNNFLPADNVGASFSNSSGGTTTYTFFSLTDESPPDGVPGLVKYCVYPSGTKKTVPSPTSINVKATGADGSPWIDVQKATNFAFARPGGNATNIPLDGKTTVMGTADWTAFPTNQTILLHINDPTKCAVLYGNSILNVSGTCFVKPSTGPICNAGSGTTGVAYNALPFGVENCRSASLGFEATGSNEFGDEVTLKTGTGRVLDKLLVSFNSWGCQSGSWFGGDCVSAAGATFTHSITAKIYAGTSDTAGIGCEMGAIFTTPGLPTTQGCLPGTPLATVTQNQIIPYRPSADPTNCPLDVNKPNQNPAQWFNPAGPPGNSCFNYIVKVLTFDFSSQNITIPDNVIWTVQFNTSRSGYRPLLCDPILGCPTLVTPPSCNSGPGGCPYDSLNVGDQDFLGATYAGTDIDNDVVFLSFWSGSGVPTTYPPPFSPFAALVPLQSSTTFPPPTQGGSASDVWTGLRPLGEILTK